mmetsp:Transcript_13044/g.29735  ORF Transcript_13044/g.29735 Transcript_13044/m.29735 type:complete len:238 (-) Transcript_13044:75-788(-)
MSTSVAAINFMISKRVTMPTSVLPSLRLTTGRRTMPLLTISAAASLMVASSVTTIAGLVIASSTSPSKKEAASRADAGASLRQLLKRSSESRSARSSSSTEPTMMSSDHFDMRLSDFREEPELSLSSRQRTSVSETTPTTSFVVGSTTGKPLASSPKKVTRALRRGVDGVMGGSGAGCMSWETNSFGIFDDDEDHCSLSNRSSKSVRSGVPSRPTGPVEEEEEEEDATNHHREERER